MAQSSSLYLFRYGDQKSSKMGDQVLTSVDNNNATTVKQDDRLLEAALNGQTDLVLQLLEEEGQTLHSFRDKVKKIFLLTVPI